MSDCYTVYHRSAERVAVWHTETDRLRLDWPGGVPELTIDRHEGTVGVDWQEGEPGADRPWQWMALWAVQAPVGGRTPLVGRGRAIRQTERLTPRSTRILLERPDRIELDTEPYREARRW